MPENIFSNFEPVNETQPVSKDYTNIKPFYTSTHGNSRLFTASYNGQKVILKTLKAELANDPTCQDHLKREYELTSELSHRNIRKALGFENIQGLGDCIVFEFVDGKTLAEHVRVGTLNEKQIKSVLIDICDALNYMHQRGIIHCDLKPENIVITANDCRAKIIDIGLPETEYKTDRELLIKENEFIAPELIKGEEGDQRSDVYSLGKIIEFIVERNMLSQFSSVATHCTQFSREQRFNSILDVKSVITKGYSVFKIVLLLLILIALGIAAYIYVPKIVERNRAEKAERLAVDFNYQMDKMKAETSTLCEKFKMNSLNEPIALPEGWKEDSVRISQQLTPFLESDELRPQAQQALENQRQAIIQSRQHDFDALLMTEFRQATDSIAATLRAGAANPSDSVMLVLANTWFQQTHKR